MNGLGVIARGSGVVRRRPREPMRRGRPPGGFGGGDSEPGFAGELQSHLGAKAGRPTMTDREGQQRAAAAMKAKGMSVREIGRSLGIAKSTVGDLLNSYCPEIVRTPDSPDNQDTGAGRIL